MSIQSAMQAGVAGLGAQSRKFATISDNIANSETNGYKRTSADFISQVTDSASRRTYSAGGVSTTIVRQIGKTGTIKGSDSGTDLAINGDGFFLVKGGLPENQASESPLLTRVGSGYLDKDGYLRLQNGYFLQGVPLDAAGLPVTGTAQSVQLAQAASPPVPSMVVDFKTNLPADAFTAGEVFETTMTYVDEIGTDRPMRLVWTPTGPDAGADTVIGTADDIAEWNLQIFDVATNPTVPASTATVGFDVSGANAGRPSAGYPTNLAVAGFNGMPIAVNLNLTQYDYSYNPYFSTDGIAVSDFAGIEVGEDGVVFSIYENGSRQPQYRLAMAEVANPQGLKPVDANAYAVTLESGDLIQRFAGEGAVGTVQGFALEGSNVDIAEELTQMITTQRSYTANASIITTSDEMLEEAVRLKR